MGCGAGLPGVLAFTMGATGKYLWSEATPPPVFSCASIAEAQLLTLLGIKQLSIQEQRRGMGLTRVKVIDISSE